jgi:site-specific DNA recombinase
MRAVIYTRFSTTQQREASSEDQARNCRRKIESEGWELGKHFKDEGISGSTTERPGYQAMLAAARALEFEVLVIDDLSRLSRDSVETETVLRRLEFAGIRILSASGDYDSTLKSRKIQRSFKGLMNEMFLDDLRAGQAIKKFWAGGRPYGYRLLQVKDESRRDTYGNAAVIGTLLEVDEVQAAIVREIFTLYSNDYSQRAIAAMLNERGIPSPGSYWRGRTIRRASGWLGSTINALIPNELYRGHLHWNKSEWRKNPDTGRRTTRARPQSEWISHTIEELRIIDEDLWGRVIARRHRASVRGAGIRAALAGAGHTGRGGPKYAFSGLLRCGVCGASMVVVGGTGPWRAYGCSGNKHGGVAVCANGISVKQQTVESRLLAPIRTELLSAEKLEQLRKRVIQKVTIVTPSANIAPRMAEVRERIENLANAIAAGMLKSSPALADKLRVAEAELARLSAQSGKPGATVVDFPARLTARFQKMVEKLDEYLARDPHRARAALREICGEIPVFPAKSGDYLIAKLGLSEMFLKAAVGSEKFMVAGVGFEPTTFGL